MLEKLLYLKMDKNEIKQPNNYDSGGSKNYMSRSSLRSQEDSLRTSDNRLLRVESTKSVVVIRISGTKNSFTLKLSCLSYFTLDKNLVLVWKVLQGRIQGDFV